MLAIQYYVIVSAAISSCSDGTHSAVWSTFLYHMYIHVKLYCVCTCCRFFSALQQLLHAVGSAIHQSLLTPLNTAVDMCIVLQALMHAREYPLGLINVDDPRDLTLSPPLQPPRHRLAGPPSTWLTGDWQGTVSSLTFHPGESVLFPKRLSPFNVSLTPNLSCQG